jgi:hypothetical protein
VPASRADRLGHPQRAEGVPVEQPGELVGRGRLDGGVEDHAGVGDQRVDLAGRGDARRDAPRIGDVEREPLVHVEVVEGARVPRGGDDPVAALRRLGRDRPPDPLRRPGDEHRCHDDLRGEFRL